MITSEELYDWIRFYNRLSKYSTVPVDYDSLIEESTVNHCLTVTHYLLDNHYASVSKNNRVFVYWSKNSYYPTSTIAALKNEAPLATLTTPIVS